MGKWFRTLFALSDDWQLKLSANAAAGPGKWRVNISRTCFELLGIKLLTDS
jgi:hypothetical protein